MRQRGAERVGERGRDREEKVSGRQRQSEGGWGGGCRYKLELKHVLVPVEEPLLLNWKSPPLNVLRG